MHIKPSHFDSLAKHILKALQSRNLASFAKGPDETAAAIAAVFNKNLEEEDRINEEAKKLLKENRGKIWLNIDEDKAFSMIKKQLAKQKNFVL